jgi:hypothetical protein
MSRAFMPRVVREIRDDQDTGPAVLERVLALVTVVMLVVLLTSTVGRGILLLVRGVSARLGGG